MASVVKEKVALRNRGTRYKQIHVQRRLLREKEAPPRPESTKSVLRLSETILEGFEVLWRQCILCDCTIMSAGRTFHAHKLILVACSDYFYDLFVDKLHQPREVDLSDVSAEVLALLLECMYTGKIHVSEENIEDILFTSTKLGFYLIEDACEDFLIENSNVNSCIKMLDRSFRFGLHRLSDHALGLCAAHFTAVCRRPQFKELPVDQILALFKRDDLDVRSELDIFRSMMDWINHKRRERLSYASELLGAIRLPLLPPSVIIDTIESVTYLMDIPECQKLVKEALHYHCVPSRQAVLQSSRTIPRSKKRKKCVFFIGGAPRLTTEFVSDRVYMLQNDEKSWVAFTHLPEPRHHQAVAVLGGFLYVAGGEKENDHCSPVKDVFRFDPRSNSWMKVANMLHNRQSFQIGVLNNCMYAVGGRVDRFESLASVERYSVHLDKWEEVAPLSSPKRCVAVATLNSRIYAVGGSGNRVISSRVECYSPTTNKWETRKSIFNPRFFAHLVPVSGSLLLIGGATIHSDGGICCVEEIEKYNPSTDNWVTISTMRTPRAEFGCCALGDRIYVAGGYSWDKSERLRSVECLNLDSLIWAELASLDSPLTGSSCVTLTVFFPLVDQAVDKSNRRTKSSPHLPST